MVEAMVSKAIQCGFDSHVAYVKTTTVDKTELIDKLTENRAEHRTLYEKAIEGYRKAALKELNAMVDAIKADQLPQLYVNLPMPMDHTADYDVAIQMLEWSVDDEVEIDNRDFRCYVLDDWGWKQEFLLASSNYTPVPVK